LIPILFEDNFLVIVNKPPLMLSQPSFNKDRIPVKEKFELENPRFVTDKAQKLFLHHRLDYETSGVFLMSKSSSINGTLTKMFSEHSFEKKYLCITKPHAVQGGKKVEFIQHDPDSWSIKSFMAPAKVDGAKKKRMISVRSGGWPAETNFRITSRKPNFFVVEAFPKTGRTHQIRHHLQESHCSILGDNMYGGKSETVARLMLHASHLRFKHPITGNELLVEAPPPPDFQKFLDL